MMLLILKQKLFIPIYQELNQLFIKLWMLLCQVLYSVRFRVEDRKVLFETKDIIWDNYDRLTPDMF